MDWRLCIFELYSLSNFVSETSTDKITAYVFVLNELSVLSPSFAPEVFVLLTLQTDHLNNKVQKTISIVVINRP